MDLPRLRRADRLAVTHPVLTYLALVAFFALVSALAAAASGDPFNWPFFAFLGVFFPAVLVWRTRRRVDREVTTSN
jgi:hypothetical protein